ADPSFPDAHYLRGTTFGALGQIDRAAECYREALAIDPQHQKAEEFLIRTEALLASREHFRSAVRLVYEDPKPDNWVNVAARELLHSVAIFKDSPARGEFGKLAARIIESAEVVFDPELALDEGPFWSGLVARAESAFDRRNWPESAENYSEALDLSSGHAFVHHSLGLIYFSLGDTESGITAWQRACNLDPEIDLAKITRISV
ncbi:MAG: tetratricopeptide repeat protein, partial [Blastocatellia bacterium]